MAERTESGEFDNIPRIGATKKVEQPATPIVTVDKIEISPALESLFQSLLGSIIVCCQIGREKNMCEQCKARVEKVERIKTQMKAEMTVLWDLRRKMGMFQDQNLMFMTYIDLQEYTGRATELLEDYKKSQIRSV